MPPSMPTFSLSALAVFSRDYWSGNPVRLAVACAVAGCVLYVLAFELLAWRARQRAAWLAEEIAREKREQQAESDRMIAAAKAAYRQREAEALRIHRLVSPHAGGKDAA